MITKTALVTGASSGIGEATALRLRELGYTVYGAARRVERMEHLAARGVRLLAMDVTDDESMTSGVERIVAETGRLDVLVNNAGYGSYGALEDVPLTEARRQFEVNVFGAIRLTQLALPHMRAQGSGRVINISSVGGRIHTPLGGWYHGTKFALEALSDCLRLETKPFAIDVVVIRPGSIRSEWGPIAADKVRRVSGAGAYAKQAAAIAEPLGSEVATRRASPPSVVADTVATAVTARRPRTRYTVGYGARPVLLLRRLLPDRAFDAVIKRGSGVSS